MKTNQLLSIATGSLGIVLNIVGLYLGNDSINYTALLLGRVSGVLFVVSIDKFYWWLLTPLTITLTNTYFQSPELYFLENVVQGSIYQVSALLTFKKLNK